MAIHTHKVVNVVLIVLLLALIVWTNPTVRSVAAQAFVQAGTPYSGVTTIAGSDATLARTLLTDSNGRLIINVNSITNTPGASDPCLNPNVLKVTKSISVTSATTTAIVAVSGTTAVYVCGGTLTIAPSGTSADTAQLEYGTGVACAGSPTALTGTFGNGDLTTTVGVAVVPLPEGINTPASNGLCVVTAGTTVNVQGVVVEVQQ